MAWPQATFIKQSWGHLPSFLSAMCVAINEREAALDEAESKFTIADGTRKTNPTTADFAGLVFARVRDTDTGTGTISSTAKAVTGVGTAFRVAGTGTIDSTDFAVNGTSTVFLSELESGDTIAADGQDRIVDEITLDSTLTTTAAFSPALSTESFEVPGEINPGEILTAEDQDRIVDEVTSATELTTKAAFLPALSADAFEVPGDGDRIQGILLELQAAARRLSDGFGTAPADTKTLVESGSDTTKWLYRDIVGSNGVGGEISTSGTVTNSGATVTGVGTAFTTEVNIGDVIASGSATPGNEYREILSIESDTSLTIDAEFDPIMSADPMPIVRGFGFTFNWWKATTWERLRQYIDALIYYRIGMLGTKSGTQRRVENDPGTEQDAWDNAKAATPTATEVTGAGWVMVYDLSGKTCTISSAGTTIYSTTDYSGSFVSGSGLLSYFKTATGDRTIDIGWRITRSGGSALTGTEAATVTYPQTTTQDATVTVPIVSDFTTVTTITTSEPSTEPFDVFQSSACGLSIGGTTGLVFTLDLSSELTDQA